MPVFVGPLAVLLGQSAFGRGGRAELLGTSDVMDRVADAFSDRLLMLLRGRLMDVAGQLVVVGALLVRIRGVAPSGDGRSSRRGHVLGSDRRSRPEPLQTRTQFGVPDAGLGGPSPDQLDEVAAVAGTLRPGAQFRLPGGRLMRATLKPLGGLLAIGHRLIVSLGMGIRQSRTRRAGTFDDTPPGQGG